jgi:sigma-B regulation protein RsbU (phosphoserine phosphatase)
METAEFGVAEEHLAPGDKVVIYTDGVTEAQNAAGGFFGKKRLREIVTAHAAEPCQAVHDAIQQAVTEFTEGAPQSDDITLVVLEFGGALDTAAWTELPQPPTHKELRTRAS